MFGRRRSSATSKSAKKQRGCAPNSLLSLGFRFPNALVTTVRNHNSLPHALQLGLEQELLGFGLAPDAGSLRSFVAALRSGAPTFAQTELSERETFWNSAELFEIGWALGFVPLVIQEGELQKPNYQCAVQTALALRTRVWPILVFVKSGVFFDLVVHNCGLEGPELLPQFEGQRHPDRVLRSWFSFSDLPFELQMQFAGSVVPSGASFLPLDQNPSERSRIDTRESRTRAWRGYQVLNQRQAQRELAKAHTAVYLADSLFFRAIS